MSLRGAVEPTCSQTSAIPAVTNVIEGRSYHLGGMAVRRLLPVAARRMVGPFTFFDEMREPAAGGRGIDVPPHPHIGLATVTYLLEGELLHRDSLGSAQLIRPGDINWMTAGRGIVHSERSPADRGAARPPLHGLQVWVALPQAHEETEPSFRVIVQPSRRAPVLPQEHVPRFGRGTVPLRTVAGS